MAKKSIESILKSYSKAQGEKRKWYNLYKPVYDYMMPNRDVDTSGEDVGVNIYSSTGEQAADRFVQRIQSMLCPVNTDWIDFETGYMLKKDNADVTEVNKELGKVAEVCNVFKNCSNFDTQATEFFYDLIAGTACLSLLEGTFEQPLRFRAIPFKEVTIEDGLFGEVGSIYRCFKLRNDLVKHQWRDVKDFEYDEQDAEEQIELIEATYFDYDDNIWIYNVIAKKDKKPLVERTYLACPFIVLRWSKCAEEVYGRGLGLQAVRDVKTLNKIVEYSLRALAFTIPVFLAQQDATYDASDFVLEPGAINPVPSTATNNPTITQLGINVNHDITAYDTNKLTMEVKKVMFDDTIPNDPSRNITATEIAERVSNLQSNLSNSFGRILNEFMYPLIKRIIEVLQSFGYIDNELSVNDFCGFGFKIKVNTVLANQQSQTEVQQSVQAIQFLLTLDASGQTLNKVLDTQSLYPLIVEKFGVNVKYIRSKAQIQELDKQEAIAIAQANDATIETDVMASNAKEEGKAYAKSRYSA